VEKQPSGSFDSKIPEATERKASFDADNSRVEPTDLQTKLESRFPENRFAVALNLALVMGLGGINGLLDNRIGIDRFEVHGQPLQHTYINILRQIGQAGRDRLSRLEGYPTPFHHLYDDMYGYSSIDNHVEFIQRVERVARYKRVIFVDKSPFALKEGDIQVINNFDLFEVCRPMSLLFMSRTLPLVAKNVPIPLDEYDLEIAYLATEPRNWESLMAIQAMQRSLHEEAFYNWGVRQHEWLGKERAYHKQGWHS
jgi:hypothetical protein